MVDVRQLSFLDMDELEETKEYREFVQKFEAKKTTDDCYTPPLVYEAVLSWVVDEYGIDPAKVVRPFYPNGDFESFDYSDGAVVVDNPPFSIVSKISRYYCERGIPFFIFAPHLTNFSIRKGQHIIADAVITYENGAQVNTDFITNLDRYIIRSAPELRRRVLEANKTNLNKPVLPKYSYPANVVTSTMVGHLATYGIDYRVRGDQCCLIGTLDDQRREGKSIFGNGYLLSTKAAAEKAAAEKAAAEKAAAEKAAAEKAAAESKERGGGKYEWKLSPRELDIIRLLDELENKDEH